MKKRFLFSVLCLFSMMITGCSLNFNSQSSFEKSSFVSSFDNESSSIFEESSSDISSSNDSFSGNDYFSVPSFSSSSNQESSSSQASSSSQSSSSSQRKDKVTLDIFAFNDVHGNVTDTNRKGIGFGKAATALKELSKDKNSIFISQGDMWQGSVESNYTRGKLVTEWMNYMDFASMTVGNHEFDWKQEYIAQNAELANFPMLGINVLYNDTNTRVEYLKPSATFERDGAKIGVIGAIGNVLSSITSSNVKDIYFATGTALTNLIKAESIRLRNEEKCDFIIYSVHGSIQDEDDYYDTTLSSSGFVDLVLEGHTHQKYATVDRGGVYHFQNHASNQDVYQITVDLDLVNRSYKISNYMSHDFSLSSSPYRNYQEDPNVAAIFDKYYDQYSIAYEELGIVSEFKNQTVLRETVADLYYERGIEKWSDNYNITLGGAFMNCRSSGIGPGMIEYGDLAECFPFDNEIVLASIVGSDFARTQFITGSSNYFITWGDPLVQYSVNYSKTYYLVTDTYTTDYYSSLKIIDYLQVGVYARDLLADYIRAGNWNDDGGYSFHAGTIDDPKTIAEARSQGMQCTEYSDSPAYYFKGVVSTVSTYISPSSGDMKNVYIKDADVNNPIPIYYLKKFANASSNNNWSSLKELKIGDELVIYGRPYLYDGKTLEFASGTYVYSINGVVTQPN